MSFKVVTAKRDTLLRRWNTAGGEVIAIYNLATGAVADDSKRDAFRGRYSILDRFYSRFEEITEQLYDLNEEFQAIDPETLVAGQLLSEFPDASHRKSKDTVRARYMDCHEIHAKLFAFGGAAPVHNITVSNATLQAEGGASGGQNFLPKVHLTKFDGSFQNWVSFRDVYKSLIHTNPSLSNISKYHQLLGALTGTARSVIAAVPISDDNYETAWKSLETAFENKRVLATVYLNRLFTFRPITGKPTPEALRLFLSQISDTVAAFTLLDVPNPCDFVLFSLAVRNLPQATREEFEFTLKKDEFPSMNQLTQFVRDRQLAVQLADPSSSFNSAQPSSEKKGERQQPTVPKRNPFNSGSRGAKTSLMTSAASKKKVTPNHSAKDVSKLPCPICQECHTLFYCVQFNHMTPRDRYDSLRHWSGCKLCLTPNHTSEACTSQRKCRLCSLKHNPLLCMKTNLSSRATEDAPSASQPSPKLLGTTLTTSHGDDVDTQVVLATAMIDVLDARGQYTKIRAVLDSASQYSYMTHKCISNLGWKVVKTPRKISCLGGMLFDSAQGVSTCTLRSADQKLTYKTEVVIVKNITSFLPTSTLPVRLRNRYKNCQLADPHWDRPGPIHALIGADLFADIISGSIRSVAPDCPKVMPTVFGDVILGKYTDKVHPAPATTLFSMQLCEDNVCWDLKRFWEIEEVPSSTPLSSQQEDPAEKSFQETSYRLSDGKFGVRLPFSSPEVPDLSSSEQAARKRFHNLEAKLQRNPELAESYKAFMKEYRDLGHMRSIKGPSKFMIPHHGVFQQNAGKIKLRVVFDGSAKTPNGSLNEHLLIGPPLQNDIRNIMTNFRAHQIAFVTDAVKMYRQIEVAHQDRGYQHIYWRDNPEEPLEKYELSTVTYGLSCSPFLALRCLKVLEQEYQDQLPMAALALSRDLYVDDVVSGHETLPQAQELQRQLILIMSKGGFQLAKWASNSPALVTAVAPADRQITPVDFSDQENPTIKVLGMQWNSHLDVFTFQVNQPDSSTVTKRTILSTAARIFDPLGLLSATVVLFKMLIQQLWLAGLHWDDPVPQTLETSWRCLIDKLDALSRIKVPRWITSAKPYTYQLVGFADASQQAMCATVYLRIINEDHTAVNLITAKTKVAPTKALTVPKLELCAALLLAKLVNSLNQFKGLLSKECIPAVYFTDSSVVLAWLKKVPTNSLKVFVSNRVADIHSLTPMASWRHVSTTQNPADLGSRGVLPDQLKDMALWWHGPSWLAEPETNWPISKVDSSIILPELKEKRSVPSSTLLLCSAAPELIKWIDRFSCYRKLIRVTALILRMIYNKKHEDAKRTGEYLLVEIVHAFYACVRVVQSFHFFNGEPPNMTKLERTYKSLSPFLDKSGIIRVGGRLRNADVNNDQRHQIFLPHNSRFTMLLIQFYHHTYLHPGPTLLQAMLQKRVWVPSLRRLVRTVTRKCLNCFKTRADAVIPKMGDLPSYRVNLTRCFLQTGVDFAGPFIMKESHRRKAPTSKVYLCLFVCMATKALHLETVTSLSTDAFLAALSRFIARRGKPSDMYSDCGTNFVGAARELKELHAWYKSESTQDAICAFGATEAINWHFNPPYSPHFGGLWEAGVKSVKRHLYLASGDVPLTFEELATLFCQIEAILNSRPIAPLSDCPEENDFLSPGHFLIGCPLLDISEPTLINERYNTLSRWQLIKQMREKVWTRWRVEYLATLQKRVKWHRSGDTSLKEGDLVLIKTKDSPPLSWPTARIIQVHPGSDKETRVVTLKTGNSIYQRSVANLVPLVPINDPYSEMDDILPCG